MKALNKFLPKKTKKSKTIFIVEDNPFFAEVLVNYLRSRFDDATEILTFPVGEVCLMALHKNPSTIIMDFSLDAKYHDAEDGISIIEQIKAHKSKANIILMSARNKKEIPFDRLNKINCGFVEKNIGAFAKLEQLIRLNW